MVPALFIYFILINVFAFSLMYLDKSRAKEGKRRVPERRIWFSAFAGGAWGASIGMRAFRHKTKHRRFRYGLPILAVIEIALLIYSLFILLNSR